MEIDELAIRCEIERSAGLHRRRDRDQAASEHESESEKNGILPEYIRGTRVTSTQRQPSSGGGQSRARPTAAIRSMTAGLSRFGDKPCSNATTVRCPRTASSNSPSCSKKSGFDGRQ